jgi:hypothetical protein
VPKFLVQKEEDQATTTETSKKKKNSTTMNPRTTTVYVNPAAPVPQQQVVEYVHPPATSSSHMSTELVVAGLMIVIVITVIVIAHSQSQTLPPHILHVPPPQTALSSALGPLQYSYPRAAYTPYAISGDPTCLVGSQYYPGSSQCGHAFLNTSCYKLLLGIHEVFDVDDDNDG